jgi:hypothetical protein
MPHERLDKIGKRKHILEHHGAARQGVRHCRVRVRTFAANLFFRTYAANLFFRSYAQFCSSAPMQQSVLSHLCSKSVLPVCT